MDKIGVRECSVCRNRIEIIAGLAIDYICQQCGSVNALLKTGVERLNVFCLKCQDTFLLPCNQETDVNHICNSTVLRLSVPFRHRKVISRSGKKRKLRRKDNVSIVIVTWNNIDLTRNCVMSIRAKTMKPYNLIFVDNCSTDGTVEYLRSILRDKDRLICLNKNRGFSAANNVGLSLVEKKSYVCFLNNDTIIEEEGWLEILYEECRKPSVGLVGPTMRKVVPDHERRQFEYMGTCSDTKEKWSYLEGWCLFMRASKMRLLGGFDERFFVYSEDADLSFRVRNNWRKGFISQDRRSANKISVVSIPVKHLGHKSSSELERINPGHSTVSNRLLYRKWVDDSLKNILVIRRGAIGDVLYTTPVIRELAKQHPKVPITYVTNCPQLIQNNPHLTTVRSADTSQFEKVIHLNYEDFPDKNLIEVMMKQAGIRSNPYTKKTLDIYIGNMKLKRKEKKITIHTGRTWASREWPIDRFRVVVKYFLDKGFDIYEVGGRETQLTGLFGTTAIIESSWENVTDHIRESTFFLGLDSAPSVIAKAVRTPAFILYGCVDPKTRYTNVKEYPIWDNNLECKGCRGRVKGAVIVECKLGHNKCLTDISPEAVIDKIEKFLKKKERRNVAKSRSKSV